MIDLNQYLPAGYTQATATGLDANGNIVGYAYTYPTGANNSTEPPLGAIAVVFALGPAPSGQLVSVTVDSANPALGATVTAVATLASAAPAGGVSLNFLSTNPSAVAAPAPVTIPEGASITSFSLAVTTAALQIPTPLRLYATDGSVSKFASLTVTPLVNLSQVAVNAVEGGFPTFGGVVLSAVEILGGAVVSLSSSNPALVSVPASVTVPTNYSTWSFTATTTAVTLPTSVLITASFNGITKTASAALSPPPVIAVSSITMPAVIGGQGFTGTVTLNNFPRNAAGATVTLASGDVGSVQVPATVVVPQGAYSATFAGTTSVVNGLKNVSVKATYNGSNVTGLIAVNPLPTVTISTAEYASDLQLLKVVANTSYANSILTYGINGGPAIGTLQFELGAWSGQALLATAPTSVTVWNSNGGQATLAVTVKASTGGGGTATSYKLAISTTGKGTVTTSPTGTTFAAGTSVTLTATPAAGSPWIGWGGACSGVATTCKLTMNANQSAVANFK